MQTETLRLAELRRLRILDTPPERYFDAIVEQVAELTDCPVALITLVDSRRQWFKARHGLAITQSRRELSFCTHAIRYQGAFEVCDTLADRRFRENLFVTGTKKVRYYAGVPLVTRAGARIGMLCVLDVRARDPMPESHWRCLRSSARAVVAAMEARQQSSASMPDTSADISCLPGISRSPAITASSLHRRGAGVARYEPLGERAPARTLRNAALRLVKPASA